MKIDIEQIELWAKVITEARQKAQEASTNEDGGTCNMDCPAIDLKGWKASQVAVLRSKVPGIIGERLTSKYWKGYHLMDMDWKGQGNNRTRWPKQQIST